MIRQPQKTQRPPEPQTGQPAETGEGWLGHNRSGKGRLWERLNPRHRKELRLLAEALVLQQITHGCQKPHGGGSKQPWPTSTASFDASPPYWQS